MSMTLSVSSKAKNSAPSFINNIARQLTRFKFKGINLDFDEY
jgi:hypothetical protein